MITRRSNRQHMRHLIVQLRGKLDSRCHLPPTMYDDVLDNEQWKQVARQLLETIESVLAGRSR